MKGTVTKYIVKGSRRPKWRYRIRLGRNGVEASEGRAGFVTETECQKAMRSRIDEIEKRRNAPPPTEPPPETPEEVGGRIKLGDWLIRWIDEYAAVDNERTTIFRYAQLARYLTEAEAPEIVLIAQTPIKQLEKMHGAIEKAMYVLLRQKAKRREHLSPKSVSHVAALMSSGLSKAFRLAFIDINPMRRVQLPKVPKKRPISLTQDQFRVLRKNCRPDPMEFAYTEVISAMGGRRGEGLALQWTDLSPTGKVRVSKSLAQTPVDGIYIKTTKEDEIHDVQLSRSALAALEIWRAVQAEQKRMMGKGYKDQGYIFADEEGNFLNPAYVSQKMKRRIKKTGSAGSLHSLRHTNATMLRNKGKVPIEVITSRFGHSEISTTLRIYDHAGEDDEANQFAADQWQKIIDDADAWEGVIPPKGPVN